MKTMSLYCDEEFLDEEEDSFNSMSGSITADTANLTIITKNPNKEFLVFCFNKFSKFKHLKTSHQLVCNHIFWYFEFSDSGEFNEALKILGF